MNKKTTSIYLESTPNPATIKFVANYLLVEQGAFYSFTDKEQASNSPLASLLFKKFSWIKEVFFASNYITLTKSDKTNWLDVQLPTRDFLKASLTNGIEIGSGAVNTQKKDTPNINNETIEGKIKKLLEEYIRPAVEQDGGAISFHSFDKGVVKVLLQGACSGCPSSTITLKAGIETLLKERLPAIKSVEAIDG